MISDFKKILINSSILAGTVIGAGIFSLPYIFNESGFFISVFYLVFLASFFIVLYLMYADTILVTPGEHQFVGDAKRYLGFWGYSIATLTSLVGIFLTLAVYLILAPSFFNLIFIQSNYFIYLIVFWALGSIGILLGARAIGLEKVFMVMGIILIVAVLFFLGIGRFNWATFAKWQPVYFFLPYGSFMFVLAGRVAIPVMTKNLSKSIQDRRLLKKSIILGIFLPAAVYLGFVFAVSGLSSSLIGVTPDAVSGLASIVGRGILLVLGVLGVSVLLSPYMALGFNIKETLIFDFKIPKQLAIPAVVLIPLLIYSVTGVKDFLPLISFIGGVFIALEGILIILIWRKSSRINGTVLFRKIPKFLIYFMLLVFSLGIIYQIIC